MKKRFIGKKYSIKTVYGKDRLILFILAVSMSFSILLFLLGILTLAGVTGFPENIIEGTDFLIFGLLSSVGPIGFYNHLKMKKKKDIENQLPDFLLEISSSTASGMTIYDSINAAARGDHGRLTSELRMMSAQLSWGISIKDALDNFAKRINTNSVKRMALTINKALEIGGNTSVVFEAAAKELDQAKNIEPQRKAEMSLYAMVIIISFFVFLAVILIIDKTIFAAIFDLQDQMEPGASIGGLSFGHVDHNMLKNTFLSFVVVQSLGGGLLSGFMMDGKLSSGVRIGFVLVLISFLVFKFMF
jgi:flagellar protein FlaJ